MIIDFTYGKERWDKNIVLGIVHFLMVFYVVLIFYPLFNMIISSLKTTREIFQNPFGLPQKALFENYRTVWIDRGFGLYFKNSFTVTAIAMVFVILFGSMAAYGVSRYKYRLRTWIYMLFLSGIMLPLKVAIIPLFLIVKNLRLMDTHISIIMIFIAMGLPSTVFILSGFMKTIPIDLEYAARIDGCNDWAIYRRIIMPVTKSAIALVTIYNAVPIWNDFFFPLVFIQSNRLKTLPVGLSTFFGQFSTNWSLLFTGLAIAILPMLILYMFMSKYFIRGMTAGAIK
ncbi:MAG: carbohydrate ABC transporter permease [Spirochaetaceae bacterium]|jgi:raffinose/stachyose/melibiose transport system permease protein|nr:carbohydrate ABC transporter permease [Spirochaetaceae bacterium]